MYHYSIFISFRYIFSYISSWFSKKTFWKLSLANPINIIQIGILTCTGPGRLAQPALNPVQGLRLLLHYYGEGEAFPLIQGKERTAPMGLLGSKLPPEVTQIELMGVAGG